MPASLLTQVVQAAKTIGSWHPPDADLIAATAALSLLVRPYPSVLAVSAPRRSPAASAHPVALATARQKKQEEKAVPRQERITANAGTGCPATNSKRPCNCCEKDEFAACSVCREAIQEYCRKRGHGPKTASYPLLNHLASCERCTPTLTRLCIGALQTAKLTVSNYLDDILQAILMRALETKAVWDPARGPFNTRLLKVATNLAIDMAKSPRYRRERPESSLVGASEGGRPAEVLDRQASNGPATVESVADRERNEAVRNAVRNLPLDLRQVVVLVKIKDCAQTEVAQELRVADSTVSKRLARALTRLRQLLDGWIRLPPASGGTGREP